MKARSGLLDDIRDGIIIAFVIAVAAMLIGAFWWLPNYGEWRSCGAPPGQAAFRAVRGKPSTLECLGTGLQQDTNQPGTGTQSPDANLNPNNPPDRPDCVWDGTGNRFVDPLKEDPSTGADVPCESSYLNPDGTIPG